MNFLEFKKAFGNFIVFSIRDIETIDPNFHRRRLNEWQDKGYIKKIIKGYYIFTDVELDEEKLFLIANKIYFPSYISLEMGLSYYHLIPESVYAITSVSSNKTQNFHAEIGTFIYQSVKSSLMFGNKLIPCGNQNVLIGDMEKVILDYFYLNPNLNTSETVKALRINIDELKSNLDQDKFRKYLNIFNNQSLEDRVKLLLELI